MARQKQQPPAIDESVFNGDLVQQEVEAAATLGRQLVEVDAAFGDMQPFNQARNETEIVSLIHNGTWSFLEAGKRLVLHKEHLPEGEFYASLERMNIESRMARRLMQAAIKYTQRLPEAKAEKIVKLGRTKLLELMVIDDDQLEALADGGTIAGLKLDEIDTLTVSELREALRREKAARQADAEVKERLLNDKNSKIDQLAEELAKRDAVSPEAAEAQRQRIERELMARLQDASLELLVEVQRFAQEVADCQEHVQSASAETVVTSTVQWIFQRISEISLQHGIPVDFAELVTPAWLRDAAPVRPFDQLAAG